MKEITDAFGYWFSGFTDGEGCFHIGKNKDKNPRTNYGCVFQITLRDDDRAILEELRNTLGIGTIYSRPASTIDIYISRPQAGFHVHAIRDCAELVKVFETYPLHSKKQRDFAIWKKAVKELQKPVYSRSLDLLEFYFLKIREMRKYKTQEKIVEPQLRKLQLVFEFE